MKRMLALLIVLSLLLPAVALAQDKQVVTFDDPVLEAVIRGLVRVPEGDVTADKLAKLTAIGTGRNYEQTPDPATQVHSLAVLRYCTKLKTLELNFQAITDVSPLAELTKLKTLELGGNNIADITPLAGLTGLETLRLFNCQAQDYSIVAGLKKLKSLALSFSTFSDTSVLAGLGKLQTLELQYSAVRDVTPLAGLKALRSLTLEGCPVSDYSPLLKIYAKLKTKDFTIPDPSLGEAVAFDDPVLEAAIRSALGKPGGPVYPADMATLTELHMGFDYDPNPPEGSRVKSVAALRCCVNLEKLDLNFNRITDISPLAGLTKLHELGLGGNEVADIAPLNGMTGLQSLWLFNCRAQDYSTLAGLTNLTLLALEYSSIADLTPLAGLTGLRVLLLNDTAVTDVSPLDGLTQLRELKLGNCAIADYSPLAAIVPQLESIDFDPEHPTVLVAFTDPQLEACIRAAANVPEGPVTDRQAAAINELAYTRNDDAPASENIFDLSALAYCTGLKVLKLENIAATDISALAALTQLEQLTLTGCKAVDYSALAGLTALHGLDLTGSAIADVTPLAALSSLEGLNLCYTDVADIAPLAYLPALTGLKLEGSRVTNFSPMAVLYPNMIKSDFVLPEAGVVRFADALLEQGVRAAMNKPEGDITLEEAASITELNLSQPDGSNDSIALLQGLEAFTGLKRLDLSGNRQLGGLWPLAGLAKLEWLNLTRCNVTTLAPLSKLTALRELALGWAGNVPDLSALAGLAQLISIDAKGVGIRDISALAGLTNLEYAGLTDNRITDVTPLAGLTHLTGLELGNNPIVDFTSLAALYPNLEWKDFEIGTAPVSGTVHFNDPVLERRIRDYLQKPEGDVTMAEAAAITKLDLGLDWQPDIPEDTQIADVSGLEAFTNLTELNLGFNRVADISPLAGLNKLLDLNLGGNMVSDIAPLAGLESLQRLAIFGNRVEDISTLAGLTELGYLHADRNLFTDLTPLTGLTKLTYIDISDMPVADIGPLAALTDLNYLDIANTQVTDLTPLAHLTHLVGLKLENDAITDFSPLKDVYTNLTDKDFEM